MSGRGFSQSSHSASFAYSPSDTCSSAVYSLSVLTRCEKLTTADVMIISLLFALKVLPDHMFISASIPARSLLFLFSEHSLDSLPPTFSVLHTHCFTLSKEFLLVFLYLFILALIVVYGNRYLTIKELKQGHDAYSECGQ